MRVALGIVYTPFLPGGRELEGAVEEASTRLEGCNVKVFDAALDALTLLDELRGYDVLVLVAPGGRGRSVYELPLREYEPAELPDEVRASLEGSLDAEHMIQALSALLAAEGGRRLRIILYRCGEGGCRRALREAIAEAARLSNCPLGEPSEDEVEGHYEGEEHES